MKKIGVLTSGGDCAGLNATIRAIVLHATRTYGHEVIGILDGTTGLIRRPLDTIKLTPELSDRALLKIGGTILGSTNKANPFFYPCDDGTVQDKSDDLIAGYKELGLDALIGIGGDGSLKILLELALKSDMNLIAIPKTIDNDLGYTELSIGYSTVLDIGTEALDRLHSTAASHHRVMILEVMGRDAGHIALGSGIAGGADVILIPEIPYSLDALCDHLKKIQNTGRKDILIVVAESVKRQDGTNVVMQNNGRIRYGGIGHYLGDIIAQATNLETRVTVLGHVQRGGTPNALDRLLGSAFGAYAVDLVEANKFNRMVAWKRRTVIDVAIQDVIKYYHCVSIDDVLVKTAKSLGLYIGQI